MIFKGLATIAYLLLCIGLFCRHQPRKHVPLMTSGMILDVSLVLILEFTRSAIASVISGRLSGWQLAHVAASTAAVVCYIPVSILGYGRLKKRISPKASRWHFRLGILAFTLRSFGYVLMYSMVEKL